MTQTPITINDKMDLSRLSAHEVYDQMKTRGIIFFREEKDSVLISQIIESGITQGDLEHTYNWHITKVNACGFNGQWFKEDIGRPIVHRTSVLCTDQDIIVIAEPLVEKWAEVYEALNQNNGYSPNAFYKEFTKGKMDLTRDEFIGECLEEELELITQCSYKYLLDAKHQESVFGYAMLFLRQLMEKPSYLALARMSDGVEGQEGVEESSRSRGAKYVLNCLRTDGWQEDNPGKYSPIQLQNFAHEIYRRDFTRRLKK